MLHRDISLEEVVYALRKSKIGKAVGFDKLPTEILKNEDINVMHKLFNYCFINGQIPSALRKVHKTGNHHSTANHTGIGITGSMYNIYCAVINNRLNPGLNTWAEELEIIKETTYPLSL